MLLFKPQIGCKFCDFLPQFSRIFSLFGREKFVAFV